MRFNNLCVLMLGIAGCVGYGKDAPNDALGKDHVRTAKEAVVCISGLTPHGRVCVYGDYFEIGVMVNGDPLVDNYNCTATVGQFVVGCNRKPAYIDPITGVIR